MKWISGKINFYSFYGALVLLVPACRRNLWFAISMKWTTTRSPGVGSIKKESERRKLQRKTKKKKKWTASKSVNEWEITEEHQRWTRIFTSSSHHTRTRIIYAFTAGGQYIFFFVFRSPFGIWNSLGMRVEFFVWFFSIFLVLCAFTNDDGCCVWTSTNKLRAVAVVLHHMEIHSAAQRHYQTFTRRSAYTHTYCIWAGDIMKKGQ